MSFRKNTNPFRFAQVAPDKDAIYPAKALLQPAKPTAGVTASALYIAAGYGSNGNINVYPVNPNDFTRNDKPPLINAHSTTTDMLFSPFADDTLLTAGGDGNLALWTIPEGGLTSSMSKPTVATESPVGAVTQLAWHRAAADVVGMGGEGGLAVVSLAEGKISPICEVSVGHKKGQPTSLSWAFDGSLVAAGTQDAKVAVFDPRVAAKEQKDGEGVFGDLKPSKHLREVSQVFFANKTGPNGGTTGSLGLVGLNKMRRPVYLAYDARKTDKPLQNRSLSQFSPSRLLPVYDVDTDVLYLTGRGSTTLMTYDLTVEPKKASNGPGFSERANTVLKESTKGLCLLPKRAVWSAHCEINRLVQTSKEAVSQYSVFVKRKVEQFHTDLYPDTAFGLGSGALDASTYASGENAVPVLVKVSARSKDSDGAGSGDGESKDSEKPATTSTSTTATPATTTTTTTSSTPAKSALSSTADKDEQDGKPAVEETSVDWQAKNRALSQSRIRQQSLAKKFKKSDFVHIGGKEPAKTAKDYYSWDYQRGPKVSLARNVRANAAYFAFPWKSVGGSALAVLPRGHKGRVPTKIKCVRGHADNITSFDLSPFQRDLLATSSAEGLVKLWRIPLEEKNDGGEKKLGAGASMLEKDLKEPVGEFNAYGKVDGVQFHPVIDGVVLVGVHDFEAAYVQCWDVSSVDKPSLLSQMTVGVGKVGDISVSPCGGFVAVAIGAPQEVQVWDPRAGSKDSETGAVPGKKLLSFTPSLEAARDTQVLWAGSAGGAHYLVTIGFGVKSARSMSVYEWKPSGGEDDEKACVCAASHDLGRGNGIAMPYMDLSTRMMLLGFSGEATVHSFHLHVPQLDGYTEDDIKKGAEASFETLTPFRGFNDSIGLAFDPKHSLDIAAVEVAHCVRLSKDTACEVSFRIPRKRKEFFQDDLYPPHLDAQGAASAGKLPSASEWAGGKDAGLKPVSLCPEGMKLLSDAPAEEMTERQKKYQQTLKERFQPKKVVYGATGHTESEVNSYFKKVSKQMPRTNRWDHAPEDGSGSDWSDSD